MNEHDDYICMKEKERILKNICQANLLCEDLVYAVFGWQEELPAEDKKEEKMRARIILTEKQKRGMINTETVVEMFDSGLSKTEIARRLGCSTSTINHHLNKAGVTDPLDRIKEEDLDVGKIIALRTAKEQRSVSWIARDMHCSEDKIVAVLKKNGLWNKEEV